MRVMREILVRLSSPNASRFGLISRQYASPPQFQIFRAASTRSGTPTTEPSWQGLPAWRAHTIDLRRQWGVAKQPVPSPSVERHLADLQSQLPSSLAECGRRVLLTADPLQKIAVTHAAWRAFCAGALTTGIGAAAAPDTPARPLKPELLPPRQIPSMKATTLPLNVYMLHNLAHVECNAIDLAWDTVVRFSSLDLPSQFYTDFAKVADDESRHLGWCLQRLEELGYSYGCMPAHNLLWEGCQLSSGDIRDRLAIVPMSQEARGLDAGGRLVDRLVGWGDNRSAAIVARITVEESAHVAVGVTWFGAVCEALGMDPGPTFREAVDRLCPDLLKEPFNHEGRAAVGLDRSWYDRGMWPDTPTVELGEMADKQGGRGKGLDSEGMQELRGRLQALLESEVQASSV